MPITIARDVPLGVFTELQHAIADAFDGDHACCDNPRVMRLPGFLHQKVKNDATKRTIHDAD